MSSYDSYLIAISGTNAIAAWGLSIALRSGQLSLAHAAFAGIGAYMSGYLTLQGWSPAPALAVGVGTAALVGLVVSVLTIRMNHLLFAISTLVFAQICTLVVQQIHAIGGPQGLIGLRTWVTWQIVVVAVLVSVGIELLLIRRSGWGLRMQLLAHDPVLTDLTGKQARLTRIQAFTLSAAIVAVAGVLRAHLDAVVLPDNMGFATATSFLVFAVVGGSSSSLGPFVGAILLTQATDRLKHGQLSASIILGLVLLAVCLLRPNGGLARRPLRIVHRERQGWLRPRGTPDPTRRGAGSSPSAEGS
jgi:branched-chain amino acid transport system permease protein